jgi:hydroxymethylbilane synthase
MKSLRIATRESMLALKQTDIVKNAILKHFPDCEITLVPLTTLGDQLLDQSLATVGGKGLFIKELEKALLDNRADIAVHSTKDIPTEITENLHIAAFLEREDPRDAFVSVKYAHLSTLPAGAIVGTASPRRASMIKRFRPDIEIKLLRGNVITRLKKLESGEYDGIVLAAAGLKRLDLQDQVKHYFSLEESLPAVGQGVIAIECRENDHDTRTLLSSLDHAETRACVLAERSLNHKLGGSCHAAIGSFAHIFNNKIILKSCVTSLDGKIMYTHQAADHIENSLKLGITVAENLLAQGAHELLAL